MEDLFSELRLNGVLRSSPTKFGKYGHLTYGVSRASPATLVADITTKANPSRGGGAKPMGLSKSAGSRVAERRLGRALLVETPSTPFLPERGKEYYVRRFIVLLGALSGALFLISGLGLQAAEVQTATTTP